MLPFRPLPILVFPAARSDRRLDAKGRRKGCMNAKARCYQQRAFANMEQTNPELLRLWEILAQAAAIPGLRPFALGHAAFACQPLLPWMETIVYVRTRQGPVFAHRALYAFFPRSRTRVLLAYFPR